MKFPARNISLPYTGNRHKYSGKEFETRVGIDLYDYDTQMQLPTAGFFSGHGPKPGVNRATSKPIRLHLGKKAKFRVTL